MSRRQGIVLKSPREIELMRRAGRLVHEVHGRIAELAAPGVTTTELNAVAEEMIETAGGTALFKGVEIPQARGPFPAALCTSVNEELVHGIPGDRKLVEGDILSVDCGVRLDGYCGDAAITHPIGEVSAEARRLLDVTRRSLDVAIEHLRPGRMWSAVARSIQDCVESEGFHVVRDYVGHGIGREMHEEPKVPNYWASSQKAADFELASGMVLAIEPMVNAGTHEVLPGDDTGWVIVTKDGSLAAHFEHSVAIHDKGADVLTNGR